MSRRNALFVFGILVVSVQLGCAENKFTRRNFEMIKEGMSTRDEVKNTLGEDYTDVGNQWEYENEDQHIHASIHFDDRGYVVRKEWMDAKKGEWEGAAPAIDERPQGQKYSDSKSHTTIKKD